MHLRLGPLRQVVTIFVSATIATLPVELLAQSGNHDLVRSGGGYLSIIKLGAIAAVYLLWVRLVDWINRDSQKLGADTGLLPVVWNPINVVAFLIGFMSAISVPMFAVGFSVYCVTALVPPMLYWLVRRSKLKTNPSIALKASAKPGEVPTAPPLPQDEGAVMDFLPAGETEKDRQVNLIRARQTDADGFPNLKNLIRDSLKKRVEQVLLDYTREQAAGRMLIDGAWHPLPPMDRFSGDAMLASLKYLAGLNPQDRRSVQKGVFRAIAPDDKADLEVTSQGTPTGERVQVRFHKKVKQELTINQLGMWPEMSQLLAAKMNAPGVTIISAPPLGGLSSTWKAAIQNSDKITRDCVAILDDHELDSELENIGVQRFSMAEGQSPITVLKPVLLKQPDCLIIPDVVNSESLDAMTHEAVNEERSIFVQSKARSAADALVRTYSISKNREQFIQSVTAVTGQRLIRRLCEACRVEVQVQPKLIQQLGGDPRQQNTIFTQFKLPPPEQRVDEKGRPIEFETCRVCSGIGYLGRIAAYELLEVTDNVRKTLASQPVPEAIEKTAVAEGKLPLIREAYKLVLLGITSIAEVQRALKN